MGVFADADVAAFADADVAAGVGVRADVPSDADACAPAGVVADAPAGVPAGARGAHRLVAARRSVAGVVAGGAARAAVGASDDTFVSLVGRAHRPVAARSDRSGDYALRA